MNLHYGDTRIRQKIIKNYIYFCSNKIYRINLERGQFLQPFETETTSINKCDINSVHHLLTVGTQEGRIEAWDSRVRNRVGILDCALHCITQEK